MARVTVEDCLDKVKNRFELVMLGSKRARQLAIEGKEPFVELENDKPTVVALREIAGGFINASLLTEVEVDVEFADDAHEDLDASLIAALAAETGDSDADAADESAQDK